MLHTNDLARAEHYLRQAAALAPNDAQIRARLARALVEVGRQEEALAETLRSVEIDPGSPDVQNDAGVVHSNLGDFDTAREHYRAALALDPGSAKAALNLAKSKRFTAQCDEDEERIRTAVDRGEWETAFAHYERANRPFAEAAVRQSDEWLALMDRIRAVFDADWFAARPAAAEPDPTPVFVVGMPRSGTTLVEQCLAAHPAVHGAGELGAIQRLTTEAAARAGAEAGPLRTRVPSMNAATRPGAVRANDGRARRARMGRRLSEPARGRAHRAHRERVAGTPAGIPALGRAGAGLRTVSGSVARGARGGGADRAVKTLQPLVSFLNACL